MRTALALLASLLVGGCAGRFREALPPPVLPLAATAEDAIPSPPPSVPAPIPPLAVESRVLENGMTVWLVPRPSAPAVSVVFVSRAAARRDDRVFRGLTRFVALALLRATEHEGRVEAELLRERGYAPSVTAHVDGTVVAERIVPEALPSYLPLLASAVRRPAFREEDLARLRADLEDAVRSTRRTNGVMVSRWLDRTIYEPGDRRRLDPDGGLPALERATRRVVQHRHAQTFVPSQSALIITGAFASETVWPLVVAGFGDWDAHGDPPEIAAPRYALPRARVLGVLAGGEQAHILVQERAPAYGTTDHAPFLVLERVLGGMFTAQLNMDLREERGASYGFSAAYDRASTEGALLLRTSVELGAMAHVLRAVIDELERVRGEDGGVTPVELARGRALAREAILAELDTTDGLAEALARSFRAGQDAHHVEALLTQLESLGLDDVHAAASRWIRPEHAAIVVLGDPQRVLVELPLAGLGDVETRYSHGGRRSQ